MNRPEIMVELIRIAAQMVSPTVHDKAEVVAHTAKQWYKECIDDTPSVEAGEPQEPAKRRGRPRRPSEDAQ